MENDLADRIRSRLDALGKSAAAASLQAGLGRSAITDILSGNTGSPRVSTIEKLAPVLETTVSYLLGIDDNPAVEFLMAPEGEGLRIPEAVSPIRANVAAGVFQEDDIFFANLKTDKRVFYVRGHPDYPDWRPEAFRMGDSSMENSYIFWDDILTVIVPPGTPPLSIPLQSGMIVLTKRRVQHEGIFEVSARCVKVRGREIHFETRPGDGGGDVRRVIVDLDKIGDSGFEDDPNQYPTNDGRIRIVGIVIRTERTFPTPD
ncbi:helix-turn-helix transcriptional regulator [Rhizobium bangladeshense]|uniref:helix-turn-helix domain-containing protein n=1 Tax=Rhizobium bangladeshense TaxID=1138189 RepID=UPI001C837EA2|nr:helix-turn-helix domain-containing protein [Rhizobium bangladeshense]MBX4901639.1 helix-turn-helix transcriptional regulator [Rhizobium bangladeshense]